MLNMSRTHIAGLSLTSLLGTISPRVRPFPVTACLTQKSEPNREFSSGTNWQTSTWSYHRSLALSPLSWRSRQNLKEKIKCEHYLIMLTTLYFQNILMNILEKKHFNAKVSGWWQWRKKKMKQASEVPPLWTKLLLLASGIACNSLFLVSHGS